MSFLALKKAIVPYLLIDQSNLGQKFEFIEYEDNIETIICSK